MIGHYHIYQYFRLILPFSKLNIFDIKHLVKYIKGPSNLGVNNLVSEQLRNLKFFLNPRQAVC